MAKPFCRSLSASEYLLFYQIRELNTDANISNGLARHRGTVAAVVADDLRGTGRKRPFPAICHCPRTTKQPLAYGFTPGNWRRPGPVLDHLVARRSRTFVGMGR